MLSQQLLRFMVQVHQGALSLSVPRLDPLASQSHHRWLWKWGAIGKDGAGVPPLPRPERPKKVW